MRGLTLATIIKKNTTKRNFSYKKKKTNLIKKIFLNEPKNRFRLKTKQKQHLGTKKP